MGSSAPETPFRLGPWRVEPSLHRLVRVTGGPTDAGSAAAGEAVRVEPKVLAVLVHLASRPGEVVSRDELLDAVWETRAVSEELVRRAVYELRKVLGDDAHHPEYIETVARSGYRLIAPVSPAGDRVTGAGRRRLAVAAAVGLVLSVLSAALVATWLAARGTAADGTPRLTPLTASPGLEYDPALSPDGSRVAFVRARQDGSGARLVVRLVGESSEIELTPLDQPFGRPAWSPEGSRVAFVRREERSGGTGWLVASLPALGGGERRLADLGPRRPYGLAWSPDGGTLAFGWAGNDEAPYALHLLDLDDGSLRRLSAPPPAIAGDGEPAFSPDGRRIAFLRNHVPSVQDVYVIDTLGGEARRITPAARKIADVEWTADGESLLAAVYEAGDHRLVRLPLDGGAPRRLSGAGEGAMGLSLARQGAGAGRLVYSRYAWRFTLWRLDRMGDRTGSGDGSGNGVAPAAATAPAARPVPRPLPELSSTRFDAELALSPDGSRVAFASSRSGSFELWVAPLSGDGAGGGGPERARRLTDFGGPWTGQPAWSPDGRSIAFASAAGGDVDLWRVDPRGGLPERLTDSPALDLAPAWAPDGRSLYFASNRSGAWEIWRRSLAGNGPAERVTEGGGYFGRPAADGRFLWFTRRGEDGLWRKALPDGEAELVVPDLESRSWGNWVLVPDGVVYVAKTPDHRAALLRWSGGSGLRELARLRGWPVNPSLAAGPGGRWLLWSQTEPGDVGSDLMLVEGL